MKKPRLFICGDSWVDYDKPVYDKRWVGYLSHHYDVILLGQSNMDNISITYQMGEIPSYQEGDRLVVLFTEPTRFFRRYLVQEIEQQESWKTLKKGDEWSDFPKFLLDIKVKQDFLWNNDMVNDEINFYKKLKNLFYQYEPVFMTHHKAFHNKTSDFVEFIKVSVFENDFHPNEEGNYQLYKIALNLLENKETPISFKG